MVSRIIIAEVNKVGEDYELFGLLKTKNNGQSQLCVAC